MKILCIALLVSMWLLCNVQSMSWYDQRESWLYSLPKYGYTVEPAIEAAQALTNETLEKEIKLIHKLLKNVSKMSDKERSVEIEKGRAKIENKELLNHTNERFMFQIETFYELLNMIGNESSFEWCTMMQEMSISMHCGKCDAEYPSDKNFKSEIQLIYYMLNDIKHESDAVRSQMIKSDSRLYKKQDLKN